MHRTQWQVLLKITNKSNVGETWSAGDGQRFERRLYSDPRSKNSV